MVTSFVLLATSTDPSFGSYLIGCPPSWIKVLAPVGVKNAGIPAPPDRIYFKINIKVILFI